MKIPDEKLNGPFVLLKAGRDLQGQDNEHRQHEITAHIGNCPVLVAAVPVGSTNGIDDQPVFRVTNAEYIRIARVMAAAPELLAALVEILDQTTGPAMVYGDGRGNDGKKTGLSHHEFNELRNSRIAAARAAIAKAMSRPGRPRKTAGAVTRLEGGK